jgi:TolB-like protein/DNA-binding winged helix-turn-helix (wHTH) protein/Tfp pilus assembly protein PilF
LSSQTKTRGTVFFGEYQFDRLTSELRRNGTALKLQPQPAKVLRILVDRAGEVITRQELANQVWGSDTHVDFEHGLNYAIRQIRTVLEEDAENPRFLETLPKRGYRFIAPVSEQAALTEAQEPTGLAIRPRKPVSRLFISLAVAALVVAAIFRIGWTRLYPRSQSPRNTMIESIAVLPLRNLSSDPAEEYFSEGMTDELITDLAKFHKLRVISHTSVKRYSETKRPLTEIARELGVDAVIEGTVTRSADRVRITAQLIDAHSDQHLWAESYERDVRDILELQRDVARTIANEVGLSLTSGEQARFAQVPTVNPAAHEAYLKGHYYWSKFSCTGNTKALEYFQEAIAKDPNFALAYAGMADTYFNLADGRCSPQDETFAKSKAAALKAVELDPKSAQAHAQLGELAFYRDWDWPKAEQELTRGVELDPNDAGIHATYAIYQVSMGRLEQGLSEIRKARQLDPVSEPTNIMVAYVSYLTHNYDQCIDQVQKGLELHPDSRALYYWLGACYEQKGSPAEAIAAYLKAMGGFAKEIPLLRSAYQEHGLPGYWSEELRTLKKEHKAVDPLIEAMTYTRTGDKEKALQALALAYSRHCDGLQFLKVEPVFDSIRDDPRYRALLSQLRL